jgi:hypothetical protein
MAIPETDYNPELAVTVAPPLASVIRELAPAEPCPSRRIAVAISPPISFPVYIRSI